MFKLIISLIISLLISSAHSATVMTVGDSLADGYGIVLPKWLKGTGWTSINKGKTSSGLVSTKIIDWPSNMGKLLSTHKPDVVVMSFGANDAGMPMKVGNSQYAFGTTAWANEYLSRMYGIVMQAKAYGAYVIWMPIPEFKDPEKERNMAYLRELQHAVINMTNTMTPDLTAIQDARYKMPDGVHYNMAGYASAVDKAFREAWKKEYPNN